MCISARASVFSFLTNLFSCGALLKFGRKELYFYNLLFVIVLIFVSLMQIVDFGMWIDLDCKIGTNKIASFFGPILNHLQPLVMFTASYMLLNYTKVGKEFYENKLKQLEGTTFDHFNIAKGGFNFIKGLNLVYLIIVVLTLGFYFKKAFTTHPELLCTGTCSIEKTLSWNWFNELDGFPMRIMYFLWNIFIINYLSVNPKSNYVKLSFIFFYVLLFGALYFKRNSVSEIWCFVVNFGALFLLLIQKLAPENYFN